jgi:cyclophilin family peptidyl-prolyl cis-trans isomerase
MKTSLGVTALCLLALGAPGAAAAPLPAKFRNPDMVTIDTSLGKIKVRLFPQKAPLTVANFLRYVDDRFYDGTVFHRVIPTFMIQGGGHDGALTAKRTRGPVKNESANGLSNRRGTVAMARAVAPDSATAQIFINVSDNLFLDRAKARDGAGYCVFGEVIEGMDVVDKIKAVPTGARGVMQDVPVENVVIKSIRRGNH